jgi:hypothetical protein
MKKLKEIFSKLGLSKENGLFLTQENVWKIETSFPNRVKKLIEKKIQPDAFFCFDNKPLILFFENKKNKSDLHEAIWNFNECPIAIIIDDGEVEIYNGFSIDKDSKILQSLGGEKELNDFSYFELVTGKTWEQYQKEFKPSHRVDYKLLKNIEATQIELTKLNIHRNIANALLGKVIFVKYLIDRKVKLNFEGESRSWNNDDIIGLLSNPVKTKDFFNYLQDKERGFNGELFPISDDNFDKIPLPAFELLQRLLSSEDIASGQKSLFDLYDFSILPIEFISNVYEKFIGKDNQADSGAFYTPTFLVDYILTKTVDQKLKMSGIKYNCKVLDPACGSGIFLVETLRKIIDKYKEITQTKIDTLEFKETLKQLAIDNIFGVDEDPNAIQVAIFSIYLTILDYLEPAEIENFQFPNLKDTNFFTADFFNDTHEFNEKFQSISFDFILGNPPWMRGNGKKKKPLPLFLQYVEKRRKNEKLKNEAPECVIGNKEIAQAFLIRSSDFSKENTKCALIVTSKILYNLNTVDFRKYFLHNYKIERVFELAPVRREVFDKSNKPATTPACVLFFDYADGTSTDSNIIEHIALKPSRFFSLFKIFTLTRTDFKKVQQGKLKKFDWLWKVLVFGSYLDFSLLNRLQDHFITIEKFLSHKEVLIKQGIKRVDGDNKINVNELLGWDFLDISKKEIEQFYIVPKHEKWGLKDVGYVYRENKHVCKDIFSPPVLLVKETVNTKLESISAISKKKLLFTDKTTAIKLRKEEGLDIYYLLAGLMNSTLFAYYVLNTSSTAGIMIEQQINDQERFSFPFVYSKKVVNAAMEIESLKNKVYSEISSDDIKENEIVERNDLLNELIFKEFGLCDEEITLVDYAKSILIPIAMRHKKHELLFHPFKYEDNVLEDYAQLFLNRFQSNLSTKDRKFMVEIWHTKQIVGMFFKVVPINEYEGDIKWENKKDGVSKILSFLIKISSEKVTDKLFVQKDIRGFEKDYFYIFKPNEKRLWHKAIGYLDVNEFADAILKVGGGGK